MDKADEPQLTEEETAALVERINANPNLQPIESSDDVERVAKAICTANGEAHYEDNGFPEWRKYLVDARAAIAALRPAAPLETGIDDDALVKLLREFAAQKLISEQTEEGDIEGAYDCFILKSRAALKAAPQTDGEGSYFRAMTEAANRITELEKACDEAFDFLGGVDGAAEMRDRLLAALASGGQHGG